MNIIEQYEKIIVKKKWLNVTKNIFIRMQKTIKSFIVRRVVNGTPPNTLKLFLVKCGS